MAKQKNKSRGGVKALVPAKAPPTPRLLGVPRATVGADGKKHLTLEPERVVEDSRLIHLYHIGEAVVKGQVNWALGDPNDATLMFLKAFIESLGPRDGIEEMLAFQMAFTHLRHARLSLQAAEQVGRGNVKVVNEACDRAAATFRRQMLALAEYRRPPRQKVFLVAGQANVAGQQVVQNHGTENRENLTVQNEQGLPGGHPAALLPHDGGAGLSQGVGTAASGVAAEHGPADRGGQAAVADQRDHPRAIHP